MIKLKRTKRTKLVLFLIIFGFCFFYLSSQEDTIATGEITVKGVSLEINPARQTVPVNTETSINTVFAVDNPGMLKGKVVKGKLRGPGINGSISLTTLPNHPFAIPGFTIKGTYTLEEVHLERDGVFLAAAEPGAAVLEVMNVILTEVKTSNNAPEGSNLTLKDLTASITFPEGLREAETNPPGKFVLTAAVGEHGIPLSPDTPGAGAYPVEEMIFKVLVLGVNGQSLNKLHTEG